MKRFELRKETALYKNKIIIIMWMNNFAVPKNPVNRGRLNLKRPRNQASAATCLPGIESKNIVDPHQKVKDIQIFIQVWCFNKIK